MTTTEEDAQPGAFAKLGAILREGVFILVGALIISTLIRAFIAQPFQIPSGSMENTLQIGDKVMVAKMPSFSRGDIVVFQDPGSWLGEEAPDPRGPLGQALEFFGILPDTSSDHLIKRVIGMPGDTVKCCDTQGRLTVNGQALDESSYLYSDDEGQVKPSDFPFEVVVPADRIFVMGDHRDQSADSRCHLSDITNDGQPKGATAFVPLDKVVGPAVLIISPLDRWRHLTVPATFADVPAPSKPAPAKATIKPDDVSCI